jgi:hypothetical protein
VHRREAEHVVAEELRNSLAHKTHKGKKKKEIWFVDEKKKIGGKT